VSLTCPPRIGAPAPESPAPPRNPPQGGARLQGLFSQFRTDEMTLRGAKNWSAHSPEQFMKGQLLVASSAMGYSPLRNDFSTPLVVLMCMVGLVLLIACLWRARDHAVVAGLAVAILVSAKLFLWPLVIWFGMTRRSVAATIAGLLAVVLNLAAWLTIAVTAATPIWLPSISDDRLSGAAVDGSGHGPALVDVGAVLVAHLDDLAREAGALLRQPLHGRGPLGTVAVAQLVRRAGVALLAVLQGLDELLGGLGVIRHVISPS